MPCWAEGYLSWVKNNLPEQCKVDQTFQGHSHSPDVVLGKCDLQEVF